MLNMFFSKNINKRYLFTRIYSLSYFSCKELKNYIFAF